jgi:hypothetical protein
MIILLDAGIVCVLNLVNRPNRIAAMILPTAKAMIAEARTHCFKHL